MYLLPPYSFCKILKKFLEPIQSYEDVPFLGPKWHICPEQFFFLYKPLLLLSSNYWPFFFTVQNFKKFLQQIQSSEDARFLALKWSEKASQNVNGP